MLLRFRKHRLALHPTDDEGAAALARIKEGTEVSVEVKRSRNARHLALYWSVIHALFEHQDRYASAENLSDAFKVASGLTDTFVLPTGKEFHVPRSISFGKMGQDDMDKFWGNFVRVMCEGVLPRMDEEAVRHILNMVDGERK